MCEGTVAHTLTLLLCAALQDKPDAKALVISSASIDFDHVCHDYTTGARVLNNVTFSVKGGQTVALVGPQARPCMCSRPMCYRPVCDTYTEAIPL